MKYIRGNDFGTEWFCKNCRYSWWNDDRELVGECRFNPPVIIESRRNRGFAAFPKVDLEEHWCAKGRTFAQPEQDFPE